MEVVTEVNLQVDELSSHAYKSSPDAPVALKWYMDISGLV
jgi:hypothetical protein